MVAAVDVVIITALKEELDALLEVTTGILEPWHDGPEGDVRYHLATLEGQRGPVRVAAMRLTQMGGVATAMAATRLTDLLTPGCLAMCGVCAGHPEKTDLGDVVIADRVFHHDQGKLKAGGLEADLWVYSLNARWLHAAQDLVGPAEGFHGYVTSEDEAGQRWFIEQLLAGRDPMRSAALRRHVPDARREAILESLRGKLGYVSFQGGAFSLTEAGRIAGQEQRAFRATLVTERPYHVHVGPIGSGNAVVADGGIWDRLAEDQGMRKALAVEMEAASVGQLAHERSLPFVVVKGVMDHADQGKDDRFKGFAARVSAEVLLELLRRTVKTSARSKHGDASADEQQDTGPVPTNDNRGADDDQLTDELEKLWSLSVPALPEPYVARPALVQEWISAPARVIQVVGSAGTGKSKLALELYWTLEREDPECFVFWFEVRRESTVAEIVDHFYGVLRRHRPEVVPSDAMAAEATTSLARVADRLRAVSQPTVLVLDIRDGHVEDSFARDMAELVRMLQGRGPRWFVFAQHEVFHFLTELERRQFGVERVVPPGLARDEVLALGSWSGFDDAEALDKVFERLSAGRHSGVPPHVVASLMRLTSVDEMLNIAANDLRELAEKADRVVFEQLAPDVKRCAAALLCFAVPFVVENVAQLFPEHRVLATARILEERGLLLRFGEDRREFHETVRRALLAECAPDDVKRAHRVIAEDSERQGHVTVAVHHHVESGDLARADRLARDSFLSSGGPHGLLSYVLERDLVGEEELLERIATDAGSDSYRFFRALERRPSTQVAGRLLALLRREPRRSSDEWQWQNFLYETALRCDSSVFFDLLSDAEEEAADTSGSLRLSALRLACRRVDAIPPEFDQVFDSANSRRKKRLLPLMLLRPDRERLRRVVEFATKDEDAALSTQQHSDLHLDLSSDGLVEDFVDVLPRAQLHQIFAQRDMGFGSLSSFVWNSRARLGPACRARLRDPDAAPESKERALRVLLFLGDPEGAALASEWRDAGGTLGVLASLAAALLGLGNELEHYRSRALDSSLSQEHRLTAIMGFAMLGGDSCELDQVLREREDDSERTMRSLLSLLSVAFRPSVSLARVLARLAMSDEMSEFDGMRLLRPVSRLEELAADEHRETVAQLLITMLGSPSARMRHVACMTLRRFRMPEAIEALVRYARGEDDDVARAAAFVAAMASHPTELSQLEALAGEPMWRALLVGRLRARSAYPWLVALATNQNEAWQRRRAALLALSRFPSEIDTLRDAAGSIVTEPGVLSTIDDSHGTAHAFFKDVVDRAVEWFGALFRRGRKDFIDGLADEYDKHAPVPAGCRRMPIGRACSEAIWSFLDEQTQGRSLTGDHVDRLRNSLALPLVQGALVLCAVRAGAADWLEEIAVRATSRWLTLGAVQGRLRLPDEIDLKWRRVVLDKPLHEDSQASLFVERVIDENIEGRARRVDATPSQPAAPRTRSGPPVQTLGFEQALALVDVSREGVEHGVGLALALDDAEQVRCLVEILAPSNDHSTQIVASEAPEKGAYLSGSVLMVRGSRTHRLDANGAVRSRLRAALIAANRWGVEVPWADHARAEQQFLRRLLGGLSVSESPEHVTRVLQDHEEVWSRQLQDKDVFWGLAEVVGPSIIPMLARYANVGDAERLAGLYRFVGSLDFPEVVPLLGRLLERLVSAAPHEERGSIRFGSAMSMALAGVLQSPRLSEVPNVSALLGRLTQVVVHPWERNRLVKAMASLPESYTDVEAMLLREDGYVHMTQDPVEELDEIADRLFSLRRCQSG